MSTIDYLAERFPLLGNSLPRMALADLPTPVEAVEANFGKARRTLFLKRDDLTGSLHGGNKLRKLEYILPRAREKSCRRIATFGAVGSNSALATALYARQCGFECTCFLMHQAKTPDIAATLNLHLRNDTELVRYGGPYAKRLRTLREHLWGRHAWVVPMGCSSWRGTVGFVAAGLELAAQIDTGAIAKPDRIYVGTGTMGTAVGLGIGLAIAALDTEVHAVRVSDTVITNEARMHKLAVKTLSMMQGLGAPLPDDLGKRLRIRLRHEFFGGGYAHSTPEAEQAIAFAATELGLTLETTYTGKALAALMADMTATGNESMKVLFWHTYAGKPGGVATDRPLDATRLPAEFLRYFE